MVIFHRLLLAIFLIVSSKGCISAENQPSENRDIFAVVETVVRYHYDPKRYSSDVAYLSVLGHDPNERLLSRLRDLPIKFFPGSDYEANGRPFLFNVEKTEFEESENVWVKAQDFKDGFFWIDYEYNLKKMDGRWEIIDANIIGK
jgi:hypothetical protein